MNIDCHRRNRNSIRVYQQITLHFNLEKEIREFWIKNQIRQKLELLEKDAKGILGYVEGPPTLNGIPHIGHARGRIMKDIRYRWKTMEGYYMPFWAGWDCQGLPVELEVEKLLGVRNKRESIEKYGMERFIEECKKAIMRYHAMWLEADGNLGVFINQEKAYWTYKDSYIEREWQILKRAWEQDLLEEGHYVVAYCPGCQTSLKQRRSWLRRQLQRSRRPLTLLQIQSFRQQKRVFPRLDNYALHNNHRHYACS